MNKAILREIILEQEKSRKEIDVGIERSALNDISKHIHIPHTVVISGIRRAGKSTLLNQIINSYYEKGVYYLNFEDERLVDFEVNDFNSLYETFLELYGERKVFFFDEIQNVLKWEIFVRRMQDKKCKFFITGSNASLLSMDGRTNTEQLE